MSWQFSGSNFFGLESCDVNLGRAVVLDVGVSPYPVKFLEASVSQVDGWRRRLSFVEIGEMEFQISFFIR